MRTLMSFGYVGSLSAFQSTGTVNGAASGFFCRARRTVRHAFWLRSMLESPEPTFCFLELMLRASQLVHISSNVHCERARKNWFVRQSVFRVAFVRCGVGFFVRIQLLGRNSGLLTACPRMSEVFYRLTGSPRSVRPPPPGSVAFIESEPSGAGISPAQRRRAMCVRPRKRQPASSPLRVRT
jgi:hypothetical protein